MQECSIIDTLQWQMGAYNVSLKIGCIRTCGAGYREETHLNYALLNIVQYFLMYPKYPIIDSTNMNRNTLLMCTIKAPCKLKLKREQIVKKLEVIQIPCAT